MKTQSLLTLCLVLCGGNPPGLTAETVYTATEGGNIKVRCLINEDGNSLIFCKNDCEGENILVEVPTTNKQKSKGRYSLQYEEHESPHVMEVSITDVVKSDSGPYRCEIWSGGGLKLDEEDFQINVTSVSPVSSDDSDVMMLEPRGPSSEPTSTPSGPSSTPGVTLYVALAALLVVLSVTLSVLFWRRRRGNKDKAPTENKGQIQVPESHHLYEEIPEQDRSATVYSLLSQPQAPSHAEVSSEATYTEVDFPQSNSAPQCQTELYSTISSTQ